MRAPCVHVFNDGIVSVLSDSYNVGILIFLVILGTMVCLMNKAGGSAAFGRWAKKNIKSRVGAQLASIVLGCLIFIDDYFNCLTVGSVMRPITDRHQRLPGQAGLHHRRHRCPGVHHRPHLLLGRRRLWLCGGRPGSDPVHPGHPL